MEIKLKLVLAIAAIILIVGFAQASTLTVCPSGCDYTSIQTAVYGAHPNDTIEVHSGTYNESIVLTKDNLAFDGTDTSSGKPIVNGDLYSNGFTAILVGFIFNILVAVWIFTDIRKRGEGSGLFIALALLAGIPAAIIYAIVRIGDKKT